MERLTRKYSDGTLFEPLYQINGRKEYVTTKEILEKLEQYEDLEITPDQVREMSRLYQEKCEEVARLEKRIEELDYIEYGCTSCIFDDERTEYDYPCSECSRLKEDKYKRKIEE